MNIEQSKNRQGKDRFDVIFEALPPLDSPEYLEYLQTATASELPPQILARAFRQLCAAGAEQAADQTLARLLGDDSKYGYLKVVHHLAWQQLPEGQNWEDKDDLFQAAVMEIVRILPTKSGALAERAWVLFCQHCFEDAWRRIHGRRGEKLRIKFDEPSINQESGEMSDPVEETDGSEAPWHVGVRESDLPWIEEVIIRTIANIADPLTRLVAEDQFGADPSPISSGLSATGRPLLTEQLGASRYQISRALRRAKGRLAGALLADKEHKVDREWLQKFIGNDN